MGCRSTTVISQCFYQTGVCAKKYDAFAKKHQTDFDYHLVERASYSANLGQAQVCRDALSDDLGLGG
jgi:hypothetical protein